MISDELRSSLLTHPSTLIHRNSLLEIEKNRGCFERKIGERSSRGVRRVQD
ncbi:hypothetical protein C2S52_005020 [Perilla frutescens var. hirtella]|nr:hypothetical protein C2S52_005020 [Perilla frutescens var. hirtella]